MKKAQFVKILGQLESLFKDDEEALNALELLDEKSANLDWKDESSSSGFPGGSYPLPSELIEDETAIALFSDGACRGNPGPGSWGMIGQIASGEIIFEASGVDVPTTNNRMELEGAIQSLERLKDYFAELGVEDEPPIFLYSDSKYVVDGITSWVKGWKSRGWKKADKKVPENVEYWQRLDQLVNDFDNVVFKWVKGHAGHPQNERCDQLANLALDDAGF